MNQLSREEQEKILDFYFRCGLQEDIDHGRDLIAEKPEAAKLYANLEGTLMDLDHIKYEPCPDNLVDLTIARLKLAASMRSDDRQADDKDDGNFQLSQLLEKERQNETTSPYRRTESSAAYQAFKPGIHHRVGELLAAAAAIMVIFSILFPVSGAMRYASEKMTCQNNLRQVGAAFSAFANDHNDQVAQARIRAGDPWWKVGSQTPETHSNTRYPWQLVKQGYVKGKVFVCRGNDAAFAVDYDPDRMGAFYDFPSRSNISYSFMLFCDKNADALQKRRKVIAADLNPLFQQVTARQKNHQSRNEFETILLNEQLKQIMSANHRGKGQNLLFCDGSTEWVTVRVIAQNGDADDIFTIRNIDAYTGKEVPAEDTDVFLAP